MTNNSKKNSLITRTPQECIDETPNWADGTNVVSASMTKMQWRIWGLATAGKFFEGIVIFMGGIALPLICRDFELATSDKGMLAASGLFGILIGASLLGGLSDYFGRKTMFVLEMFLFAIFITLATFSTNFIMLLIALVGMGISLGCDYPTAHIIISENIPSRMRGKLVLGAFGFQSLGVITGTLIGYLVMVNNPNDIQSWKIMYGIIIIPAILVALGRLFISESANYLVSKGEISKAENELKKLLKREPEYPKEVYLKNSDKEVEGPLKRKKHRFKHLFNKKNRKATALASIPWFLQDIGTYGIGIFTPIILANSIGVKSIGDTSVAALIHNDIIGAKGAAFIDIFVILGIIAAVFFTDKLGRIKLQIIGFIGAAIGLGVAAYSIGADGSYNLTLLFGGFILFNFLNNMGPNAQTYLIAGEVFPTKIRGRGAGFAASFAKIGSVTTAFLFPVLLHSIGTPILLIILIGTSLLGAVITYLLRIDTRGKNLDEI